MGKFQGGEVKGEQNVVSSEDRIPLLDFPGLPGPVWETVSCGLLGSLLSRPLARLAPHCLVPKEKSVASIVR